MVTDLLKEITKDFAIVGDPQRGHLIQSMSFAGLGILRSADHPSLWVDKSSTNSATGAYMLRLRKFRHEDVHVNICHYAAVYSIFSMVASSMFTAPALDDRRPNANTTTPFYCNAGAETYPAHRHVVRLYPGGGFKPCPPGAGAECFGKHSPGGPAWARASEVSVVATQRFTAAHMDRWAPRNPRVDVFGGSNMYRGEALAPKLPLAPNARLVVCFTSLGDRYEKGADLFVAIAEGFTTKFPDVDIAFHAVGNAPESWAVHMHSPMPQAVNASMCQDRIFPVPSVLGLEFINLESLENCVP